jgi:hypothetical protein
LKFLPDAPIEDGPKAEGDRHVIAIDRRSIVAT